MLIEKSCLKSGKKDMGSKASSRIIMWCRFSSKTFKGIPDTIDRNHGNIWHRVTRNLL